MFIKSYVGRICSIENRKSLIIIINLPPKQCISKGFQQKITNSSRTRQLFLIYSFNRIQFRGKIDLRLMYISYDHRLCSVPRKPSTNVQQKWIKLTSASVDLFSNKFNIECSCNTEQPMPPNMFIYNIA